jgi:hypothetical protein
LEGYGPLINLSNSKVPVDILCDKFDAKDPFFRSLCILSLNLILNKESKYKKKYKRENSENGSNRKKKLKEREEPLISGHELLRLGAQYRLGAPND